MVLSISPEGCASILFRDANRAEDAAEALKPILDLVNGNLMYN